MTVISLSGCKSISKSSLRDFTIHNVYYQSWIINENEKGVDLEIFLKKVKPEIVFETVIFRGIEMPVSQTIKRNEMVILKARYNIGIPKIELKHKLGDEEDQLIYNINKIKKTVFLKEIKRRKTKYY